ncbi:response regulator, partial [Seonamhaeicola sp.]|uniref:hybrid sensor histidine kinase/response regulator transcription factor n=1 Tax=Seonamhaeicola sp. TaxID=1912245 RepID=UPI00356B5CE7
LGTDGAGLSYYDKDLVKFNVLTNKQAPDNINIDFVRAITEQKGVVWLGTSNKGLTSFNLNTNTYQKFTTNNSALKSDRIMSLFTDNKNLWIGHQNDGLQKLTDGHKFEDFDETNTISIWKIYKAQNHRLWLCTLNGLLLFEEQKGIVKSYNTENSNLTSNAIRTVEAGETNTLWIGSESDGLFRLNTLNDSLVNIKAIPDRIKSLYYNNHILWVGTNGNGLKAYNTKTEKISHFTIKDGLANNVIYGILPDGNNNLWLSSNNGLTRASISKDSVVEIENFNNYDGLQTNEFNTGAYFKNNNGMLYFGGLEGLNWFNPNTLTYNTIKPKTVITNFDIFSKPHPIKQGEKFSSKQNTMTFTFSGLHYSQPDRNQYKYQLLNHDSDWVLTGNNNKAHYTNLPPGDYTFKVLSSNYDGVWSNIPATYSFTILKPWYLTNLLKILYALTVILILFGIYKYLQFRWKVKTQLQLKQAETERLKKLDEFKTKLYTNISHEFRTPLTLITGPIDHQLSKHNLEPNDRKELNLIKQNANRLLGLVNQMVDLALIDSGQAQLKIENGNLKILLIQIVSAFQYKAKEKYMVISSRIEGLENVWYDKDVIEKISSNLLANAIKYAPESSEIIFDANEQGNNLVLSVINTNKEITKKDLGKLFKRFYKDDEASEGVGVGLALVKELVSLSNGSIIANSIDLDKIQFTVTLPITKDAFKSSEILNSKTTEQETVLNNVILSNENKPCLLIVEDNKDIRTFVKSVFENSYQIIEASNGQAGIKKAIKHMPSLIISDIMMPIKNGIDLCNTLKYNELTSHIPIILLTAKVGEDNELEGLKTGAEAYITKPFSSKKLKLIVEKQIENRNRLQQHFSKSITLTPEITVSSTEAEFLKRLKEVLDKNLTNPDFNTETFSVKMQMSRTQLHRKLKAIVGLSTSEFIRNERLKLAINLLKTSDNSISEIAYQIGFNTPSYFIKCFKEAYNCTPVEYSKRG